MDWMNCLMILPTLATLMTQLVRKQISPLHFVKHVLETFANVIGDPDAKAALLAHADHAETMPATIQKVGA